MRLRRAWLAVLATGLAACGGSNSTIGEPVQRLENLELSQSQGRTPGWNLKAASAVLQESDKNAALVEPRMEIFKNGRPATRLSARAGFLRTDNNDLRLSTGVVVTSLEDGAILKTEELLYSSARAKFFTEKEVTIIRKDGVVHGQGLEASPDLSKVTIFNQRTQLKDGGG